MIPNAVFYALMNSELTGSEVQVLLFLSMEIFYHDRSGKMCEREFSSTFESITEKLQWNSVTTTKRSIGKLKRRGWIIIGKKARINTYRIDLETIAKDLYEEGS